jgi:hypothetical protein
VERRATEGNKTRLLAGNWEWYYPDESKTGESIGSIVGYSAPSVSSIQRHANVMAREADAILSMAGHRPNVSRSYIGVVHQDESELGHKPRLDSTVYLAADPEMNKRGNMWSAVRSIEFGHWTKNYSYRRNKTLGDKEGPIRNQKRGDGGKSTWVEGVSPLQKAAKKMVGRRRMSIK